MSLLRRLRDALSGSRPAEGPPPGATADREPPVPAPSAPAAGRAPASDRKAPPEPEGAAELRGLEELLRRDRSEPDDEARALAWLDRLAGGASEARALAVVSALAARAPSPKLACRAAERLDARGDEEGALALLEPLAAAPEAPLDGWMLAAEIRERRGDVRGALGLYERIVARDVDYPRARERALRLRELAAGRSRDDGATLAAEGALTRGRYRLVRELGRGGAGAVFLAQDSEMGRQVALKVYHRRGRADRARLLHEARTAASLEHPGVVRVLDVDESLAAIAMELTSGSVRTELGRGRIPLERLGAWMRGTARALRFAHQKGVVHRDVKPSNLLLADADRIVLTDFGIALRAGERPAQAGEGSAGYMAPEQQAGAPAHPAMDVHALGATIRELAGELDAPPPDWLPELALACLRADPAARPPLDQLLHAFDR